MKQRLGQWHEWIWTDGASLPRSVLRLAGALFSDLRDGSLALRATSLVYTTLLSLVPLLALAFSVIKGFGGQDTLEPFLREVLSPLGRQADELVIRILEFVANINVGVLGAVGLAFLIFSVLSLMQKVESSFNHIWRVPAPRSFVLRLRDHLSVLLIGPLFIFLSMGMTASLRYDAAAEWLGIEAINALLHMALLLVPYILFTLAFTAIYLFIPNTRVRLVPALAAGAFTSVLWKALGWGFGIFVQQSSNVAAIYSAFAALILLMIWLYIAWLVVLLGASVAYYLQNPASQRLAHRPLVLSAQQQRQLCLLLLAETSRRFYAQKSLILETIAQSFNLPLLAVAEALERLCEACILRTDGLSYLPALPFDELLVSDVIMRLDQTAVKASYRLRMPEFINALEIETDKARAQQLAGLTVKQLGNSLSQGAG